MQGSNKGMESDSQKKKVFNVTVFS